MKRFPLLLDGQRNVAAAALVALALATGQTSFAAAPVEDTSANLAKNLARMNSGAQIECTTPDGRVTAVATANDQNKSAAALIMDDDSLSCPLQEGETTFVIKLPPTSLLDRFSFVNENATAAGELKISVSNHKLPANSPQWVDVDGSINFTRKRLFNLSMVGVEARYLKPAFNVQKPGRIASLGLYGAETLDRFAARQERQQQQFGFAAEAARYIALRWTPENGSAGGRGFEIAEIHAFGDVPMAFLSMDSAPDLYASNSSALKFTGQGSPDLSNTLGTIAVPPTLPAVSP